MKSRRASRTNVSNFAPAVTNLVKQYSTHSENYIPERKKVNLKNNINKTPAPHRELKNALGRKVVDPNSNNYFAVRGKALESDYSKSFEEIGNYNTSNPSPHYHNWVVRHYKATHGKATRKTARKTVATRKTRKN
jgi:hypothetical protein